MAAAAATLSPAKVDPPISVSTAGHKMNGHLPAAAAAGTNVPSPAPSEDENESDVPRDSAGVAADENENENELLSPTSAGAKKKKKKKGRKKKDVGSGDVAGAGAGTAQVNGTPAANGKKAKETEPSVLCISRNKHWRYISSYHGPWLQLPVELLESLLVLNVDVNMSSPPSSPHPSSPLPARPRRSAHTLQSQLSAPSAHARSTSSHGSNGSTSDAAPSTALARYDPGATLDYPLSPFNGEKPTPPPIDPGVFRSVTQIRRLIDEAADLAVRAASGLSAASLASMPSHHNQGAWSAAQTLGINPLGNEGGRGREGMSAMRTHRLRALAVQRLAMAYKADEIAASVMVMQGASALDDVAQRVLRQEPNNADARYVHFFHEKIPSRQLAESTPTTVLDELIAGNPLYLEYYRTRGIVRCFRDEFAFACRDFTHAIKQSIQLRKARHAHDAEAEKKPNRSGGGKGKGGKKARKAEREHEHHRDSHATNGNGDDEDASANGDAGKPAFAEPPSPLEAQCLFLRGAAYLQHSVFLIEQSCLNLEGVKKPTSPDLPELRLCYLEHGKYGGTEVGNPDGPLGPKEGAKLRAYRARLGASEFRQIVFALLRKSIRDHERFLGHFDTLETGASFPGNLAERVEAAFHLSESQRPGQQQERQAQLAAHQAAPHAYPAPPPLPLPDGPAAFTTYHPLLVESHFSILICYLLLGDFAGLLSAFQRTAMLVDGLEGYPIFLPARSMAQAEFVEVLERLAGGWRMGIHPHSLAIRRLAIEASPPVVSSPSASASTSASASRTSPEPSDASSSTSTSTATAAASTSVSSLPSSRSDTPVSVSAAPSSNHKGKGVFYAYDEPPTPSPSPSQVSPAEHLDAARMLLAPVVARQRRRAEKERADRAAGIDKKKGLINIPLHGPRVEIVLAWIGAVHLPDLEGVPQPGNVKI